MPMGLERVPTRQRVERKPRYRLHRSALVTARVRGGLPGTEKDGIIYGDLIKEITPDGEVVWQWGTREMEIEKYPICPLCPRAEFAHANTCSPMPNGDIMVSFRVLNILILIDSEMSEIKMEYQAQSHGHGKDGHGIKPQAKSTRPKTWQSLQAMALCHGHGSGLKLMARET